jgi:hypothetical protein
VGNGAPFAPYPPSLRLCWRARFPPSLFELRRTSRLAPPYDRLKADVPLSPNRRGSLFMAVGMAGFTMNDTITKAVSSEMNFGQVMLVRGLFAIVLIAPLAWHQGALRTLLVSR